ncbi:MAG: Split soret cytochrome c precursor, partial [bacterium]
GAPVGTPFNPVPRAGNLNSSSALLIAQRNPLLGGGFFAGSLDEVEIIRRELSATEVADLFEANVAGKCPESCYATQNATCCAGFASSSAITICNYSLSPHTYSWGLSPLNGGPPGCGPVGATAFSPAFGSVTVPAQGCVTVPVYIGCPSNIPPGQSACYSVSIFNHDTGRSFGCQGSVRRVVKWCWHDVPIDPVPIGSIHEILAGTSKLLQFEVGRVGQPSPGMPPMTLDYMITAMRGDNGEPSQGVRLNGLPPGEPYIGNLSLEAGGQTTVLLEASYDEEALIGYDLVAWGYEDGDGLIEPLGEAAVRSTTTTGTSAVPGEPGQLPGPADVGRLLLAFPNPFGKSDQIRFRIEGEKLAKVKLRLFDLQGRIVKVFYLENVMEPGEHSVTWNTLDNRGQPLRSGIYFLRLDVDNRSETVKLMVRP